MFRRTVVSALLAAFILIGVGNSIRHAWPDPHDFGVRYAAAVLVREGHDPYNPAKLTARLEQIEDQQPGSAELYGFHDPPVVAHLLRPLTALGFKTAAYVWLGILLVSSFIAARLALDVVGWASNTPEGWLATGALAVGLSPLRYGIEGMQIDPVYAALAIAALWLVLHKRPVLAGVTSAFALLKPQTTTLPAVAFDARRRRWVALSVTAAVLALGPVLVDSPATWGRWRHTLGGGTGRSHSAWSLTVIAVVIVIAVATWLRARPRLDTEIDRFAAAAAVNVIVFSLIYLNAFSSVLLLVPCLVIARRATETTLTRLDEAVAGILLALVLVGAMMPSVHNGGLHAAAIPVGSVALLVLAACAAGWKLPRFVMAAFIGNALIVVAGLNGAQNEAEATIAAGLALLLLSRLNAGSTERVVKFV